MSSDNIIKFSANDINNQTYLTLESKLIYLNILIDDLHIKLTDYKNERDDLIDVMNKRYRKRESENETTD